MNMPERTLCTCFRCHTKLNSTNMFIQKANEALLDAIRSFFRPLRHFSEGKRSLTTDASILIRLIRCPRRQRCYCTFRRQTKLNSQMPNDTFPCSYEMLLHFRRHTKHIKLVEHEVISVTY